MSSRPLAGKRRSTQAQVPWLDKALVMAFCSNLASLVRPFPHSFPPSYTFYLIFNTCFVACSTVDDTSRQETGFASSAGLAIATMHNTERILSPGIAV